MPLRADAARQPLRADAARQPVEPHFYDDGTLRPEDCALLQAKLPRARFFLRPEIEARLAAQLPAERFPCLHRLRPAYPHIRKLTDQMVASLIAFAETSRQS